jgi:hypothetical protein
MKDYITEENAIPSTKIHDYAKVSRRADLFFFFFSSNEPCRNLPRV